jgi:exodeoxyribonuclease X
MLELTKSPILLKKFNFWKHKWGTFEQVAKTDPSYIRWLSMNSDDENVRYTCGKYI